MLRLCTWLLLTGLLAVAPRPPAHAQQVPAPPATTKPAAAPPGTLSPEQARAALDTLNDPKKRAALAAALEALVHGSPPPEPAVPPAPPAAATPDANATPAPQSIAIQLAPDSLGAQLLLAASAFLNHAADGLPRAWAEVQSVPLLWAWVVVMLTNPLGQQLVADVAWRLLVTLVLAEGVALTLRYLLRRPLARVLLLGQRKPASIEADEDAVDRAERGAIEPPPRHHGLTSADRRIGLGLARFALQMVPVLGLLVVGHAAAASSLGGTQASRLVILAVIEAIALCQTLLAILTLLFRPDPPGLRLLTIRPSVGAWLMRWGRRLVLIAVPGYAIGEVALLLNLAPVAHDALQKVVGLALAICLAIMVMQRRRAVRRGLTAPPDATGVVPRLRNVLARSWHWIALFFLAAMWLSWTLRAPDAIARALWYFGATAVVLVAASMARLAVSALFSPMQPGDDDDVAGHPFRMRFRAYHPMLRRLARLAIDVLAVLALLQLYGLGGLYWLLSSNMGRQMTSGLGTLAVTIGLALAIWEGVNIAIQMHLETLRRDAQATRSARLRTLLPLIRTTLAITVAVVAGLMVLSEIGVNIAPLLAGAGIVGVAIGFGSQKLVQDVITGVFLLLENTMQVGDVVKVGDQTGIVESLSVRTIRLRTEDASVVVIPFSAVTTVINMTRDYSRAVIQVNVGASEDIDRVLDTMREIVREMRAEATWSAIILDDLEVWGLDRFTDTALQIKCRIMCTPFGRWPVGREFNRRIKSRFQMVGIATPFSALTLLPRVEALAQPARDTAASVSQSAEVVSPAG
jgi:small-conductance mechanosensitive channel